MLSLEHTSFSEKPAALLARTLTPGVEIDVTQWAVDPHLQTDKIDAARAYFRGLRPSQRHTLKAYLTANAPDEFTSDDADLVDQLAQASDDQLGAFLDWNATRTAAVNADPAVQTEIEARRNRYKQLLQNAIVRRLLLPEIAESAIDRAGLVPIVIGDVFSTELRSMNGFYVPQTGVVVLKQTASAATFEHEMNHAALGKLPSIFNEAFTTHIQEVLHTGAPDVLNPYDRADHN